MSDDKLNDATNRALQAETLSRNEFFKECLDTLELTYYESWKLAQDTASRERIWHCLFGLERLRIHLQQVINDGKMAALEIQRLTNRVVN